jgi:hypothetical protein
MIQQLIVLLPMLMFLQVAPYIQRHGVYGLPTSSLCYPRYIVSIPFGLSLSVSCSNKHEPRYDVAGVPCHDDGPRIAQQGAHSTEEA